MGKFPKPKTYFYEALNQDLKKKMKLRSVIMQRPIIFIGLTSIPPISNLGFHTFIT